MGERSDRGRLASPLFPQERETSANPFGIYHSSGESSEGSFSHLHTGNEKSKARSHNKRMSSRDSGFARDPHLEREKILSEQKEIQNLLERKADQAFRGERAARTRLSEAQSELDRREWKMQSADRALHGSGFQLHSQRMELYQANQLTDQSQKEKSWLCTDLEMREGDPQEDRLKSYQELQDLKRICCAEAERARQLRIDEL